MTNQSKPKSVSSSTYDPRTHKHCRHCGKIFKLNHLPNSWADDNAQYCQETCRNKWWKEWRKEHARNQNKKNRLEIEDAQLMKELDSTPLTTTQINKPLRKQFKLNAKDKLRKSLHSNLFTQVY